MNGRHAHGRRPARAAAKAHRPHAVRRRGCPRAPARAPPSSRAAPGTHAARTARGPCQPRPPPPARRHPSPCAAVLAMSRRRRGSAGCSRRHGRRRNATPYSVRRESTPARRPRIPHRLPNRLLHRLPYCLRYCLPWRRCSTVSSPSTPGALPGQGTRRQRALKVQAAIRAAHWRRPARPTAAATPGAAAAATAGWSSPPRTAYGSNR